MNTTSRERVRTVLHQGVTDYIPKGELCINDEVITQTLQVNEAGFAETLEFMRLMNLDIFTLSPKANVLPERLPDRAEFQWPDLRKWVSETSLFTFAVIDGAFEWGMRLFGIVEFSSMLRSPLTVAEIVGQVEKLNSYMIDKLSAEGIDGIILADDIAYQQGLFAQPPLFQEKFIPSLARQVEQVLDAGLPVFYHSDGDYRKVMPDILQAGFTGLQCLEKTAGMEMKSLRATLASEVCLWGHLDTDDLTAAADADSLQSLLEEIKILSAGQKFILGTTSGLYGGMNLETLQALYQAL